MSTASISELKARLSAFLREVRQGGEVQVLDRGKMVARLVPMTADRTDEEHNESHRRQRLIASGILRPGTGVDLSMRPFPESIKLGQALEDERTDRR
jgi:prevent-host-death family protein